MKITDRSHTLVRGSILLLSHVLFIWPSRVSVILCVGMGDPTFEGLVLAGGKSTRMGIDKAMLMTGDQTFLEHQIFILREAGCRRVRVAARPDTDSAGSGYDWLYDRCPDLGPLEPIAHGLGTMMESHLVVLAVDLPMMTPRFVRELMRRCDASRGCVPLTAKGWEPLAAIYEKSLAERASEQISRGVLSIRELVDFGIGTNLLSSWEVEATDRELFLNVNHPGDVPNHGLLSSRRPWFPRAGSP